MENAVEVKQLSKIYKKSFLGKSNNFQDEIIHKWKLLFSDYRKKKIETIVALDHVNFDLEKGDVLGIIGRNGAGKTTLLKVLAGVVHPTSGRAQYRGTLVSILDFGTGFHPDLTGKENIYLNGSLLGMSQDELNKKFEAIVEFSELGEFVSEPVKHYSNGMYLRLAFSIFTHFESDILLLDEVISVGDLPFRQKCYNQISKISKSGTSIIMVSHDPDQIKLLCNKCIWLENGCVKAFGATDIVLENYLEKHLISETQIKEHHSLSIKDYYLSWMEGHDIKNEIRIFRYGMHAKNKNTNDPIFVADDIEITIEFEKIHSGYPIELTISIRSLYDAWVLVDSYGIYSRFENEVTQKGRYVCKCTVPGGILNFGLYQLGLIVSRSEETIYQNPYLLNFRVQFQERAGIKNDLAKQVKSIIQPFGIWEIHKV